MLIKPKEIQIKSQVGDENVTKNYRIGRYPALDGVYMLGLVAEIMDVAARGKTTGSDQLFAKKMRDCAREVCKYVEALPDAAGPDDAYIPLTSDHMINAHVPDQELLLKLVREVHDYNSFFFNSERLLKTSLTKLDLLKAQVTKILTGLSGLSSQSASQHSKSSGKSTTSKTK